MNDVKFLGLITQIAQEIRLGSPFLLVRGWGLGMRLGVFFLLSELNELSPLLALYSLADFVLNLSYL